MPMKTTLISADQLHALLQPEPTVPDLIVFDCSFDLAAPDSAAAAYVQWHIPGAIYLHLDRDLSGLKNGKNGRHPLPDAATFAGLMAALGVNRTSQVIAYDGQGGMFAARLWWLLRWLGHDAVAVLDGGLQAWHGAGFATTDKVPPVRSVAHSATHAAGNFQIAAMLNRLVTTKDILANLQSREALVIDARAPDRYRGENETLDPRAGHIPGARNRFFKDNLQADGHFKPAGQLRSEYLALLDDTGASETIQQCGSGVTACHNLLAMEVAGLTGAALYSGSWSEWSADPQRPIQVGAEP